MTASKPAMAALAGLVPWALSGMRTRVPMRLPLVAEIGGGDSRAVSSPWAPAAGCSETRVEAGDLGEDILHLPEQFQHALAGSSSLCKRMQVGQARQGGQPFVPLGVVLHGTRPERIEIGVDRHVPRATG